MDESVSKELISTSSPVMKYFETPFIDFLAETLKCGPAYILPLMTFVKQQRQVERCPTAFTKWVLDVLDSSNDKVERITTQLKNLESSRLAMVVQLDELRASHDNQDNERNRLQKINESLREQVNELLHQVQTYQNKVCTMHHQLTEMVPVQDLMSLKARMLELQEEVTQVNTLRVAVDEQTSLTNRQAAQLKEQAQIVQSFRATSEHLAQEAEDACLELAKLRGEYAKLQYELERKPIDHPSPARQILPGLKDMPTQGNILDNTLEEELEEHVSILASPAAQREGLSLSRSMLSSLSLDMKSY